MSRKVTILDVASAAGVSRGAVTRALNDKADINPDTKKRVLEVAAQLGYRPSRFARNFAARTKARAIGYVVSSFRNPYFTDLAADMLAQGRQKGWQVVIAALEGGTDLEALETLAGQVDVVVGHFDSPEQDLKSAAGGIPIINIEATSSVAGVHSIEINLRTGLREAIQALGKGASHFGMIDSTSNAAGAAAMHSPRCAYFREFVDPASRDAIVAEEESLAGGGRAIVALMNKHPQTEAVIAFNDIMAIGAIHAARLAGFDVPKRLRIMGIDGLSLGAATSPSLSSISIDRQALVAEVFALSEEIAANCFRDIASINREIFPQLVWRESA